MLTYRQCICCCNEFYVADVVKLKSRWLFGLCVGEGNENVYAIKTVEVVLVLYLGARLTGRCL